jgi:hypothetical protein
MSEIELDGAVAPAPGATPVPAPGAPAGQENATTEPVKPAKTYTEEENRKIVSDRLGKERRRLEKQLRAEIRADFLEQQLRERDTPQARSQPSGKPKKDDYQNVDDYLDAVVDWRLEQRETERTKKDQEQRGQRDTQEQGRRLYESCLKGADELGVDDFEEVALADELDITKPMMLAISECKSPAAILYHLGQNPVEATRISKLPQTHQIRAIAAIESKLKATPEPSKAPAPIVPTNPTGKASKDWKDMGTEEHIKAWASRKR